MQKPLIKFDEVTFFELFASVAEESKQSLVLDLLALIRKGDASAVRLLEKALDKAVPNEENKPIPILMGASQAFYAVPANNSAKQNSSAKKAA